MIATLLAFVFHAALADDLILSGQTPVQRELSSLISFESDGTCVMFGGVSEDGTFLNDLWMFRTSNSQWLLQRANGTIPARAGHSMVRSGNSIYLFGGFAGSGSSRIIFGDMYILSISNNAGVFGNFTWVPGLPLNPSPRYGHSAVLHSGENAIYMFGGMASTGLTGEFWSLNLGSPLSWTSIQSNSTQSSISPPPRYAHSATYFSALNTMILFGGVGADDVLEDVWSYLFGSGWVQIFPASISPTPRAWHSVLLSSPSELLMFGGEGPYGVGPATVLPDAWTFDIYTLQWTSVPSVGYRGLARSAAASTKDGMLTFGGRDSAGKNAAYLMKYDGEVWEKVFGSGSSPSARVGAAGVYLRGVGYLFGGQAQDGGDLGGSPFRDLWAFTADSVSPLASWSLLNDGVFGSPPARGFCGGGAVYGENMIIVAGVGPRGTYLNDLWLFNTVTQTWTEGAPAGGGPSGLSRSHHSAVVLANQLVVFGGRSGSTVFNDIYTLPLTDQPVPAPSGSPNYAIRFDGVGDIAVVTLLLSAVPSASARRASGVGYMRRRRLLGTDTTGTETETTTLSNTATSSATTDASATTGDTTTSVTDTTTFSTDTNTVPPTTTGAPTTTPRTTTTTRQTTTAPPVTTPPPTPTPRQIIAGGFGSADSYLPGSGGNMTVEMLIKVDNLKPSGPIIETPIFEMFTIHNRPFLRLSASPTSTTVSELIESVQGFPNIVARSSTGIADGKWRHVAVTTSDVSFDDPRQRNVVDDSGRSLDLTLSIHNAATCSNLTAPYTLGVPQCPLAPNLDAAKSVSKPRNVYLKFWPCATRVGTSETPSGPLLGDCAIGLTCCLLPNNTGLITYSYDANATHTYRLPGRFIELFLDGNLASIGWSLSRYSITKMIRGAVFGTETSSLGVDPALKNYTAVQLDEIRLWDIRRPADKINFFSNITLTPTERASSSLKNYWNFDNLTATQDLGVGAGAYGIPMVFGENVATRFPARVLSSFSSLPSPSAKQQFGSWTSVSVASSTSPSPRYAHAAAVSAPSRFIIHGGLGSVSDGAGSLTDVWEFDLRTSAWSAISATVPALHGHTAIVQSAFILHLFGGLSANISPVSASDEFSNVKVYLRKGQTASVSVSALPISRHTMFVSAQENVVFVAAGARGRAFSSGITKIGLSDSKKSTPSTPLFVPGTIPTPRYGSAGLLDFDTESIYIFGGLISSTASTPDFWHFDTTTRVWRKIILYGYPAGGLGFGTGMVFTDTMKVLCQFGGVTVTPPVSPSLQPTLTISNAFYYFSTDGSVYGAVRTTAANWPSPRYMHASTYDGVVEIFWIHGGLSPSGAALSDLYLFEVSPCLSPLLVPSTVATPDTCPQYMYLASQTVVNGSTGPGSRFGHSMMLRVVQSATQLVVFGGSSADGNSNGIGATGGVGNNIWIGSVTDGNVVMVAWGLVSAGGTPPPPRKHASATLIENGNMVLVFGGEDGDGVPVEPLLYAITLPSSSAASSAWRIVDVSGTGRRTMANLILAESVLYVLCGRDADSGATQSLYFDLSKLDPKNSAATLDAATVSVAGTTVAFSLSAVDLLQRRIPATDLSITVSGPANTIRPQVTLSRSAPPVASVSFIPLVAGTYRVSATHFDVAIGADPVASPYISVLMVVAGEVAPTATVVSTTGALTAGVAASFSLATRDSFSNAVVSPADVVVTAAISGLVVPATIQSNADSTYVVTLLLTLAANYSLAIKINDAHVANSPMRVGVVPGPAHPPYSYCYGPGLSSAAAGSPSIIYLQTRDAYKNNLTSADASIGFDIIDASTLATIANVGKSIRADSAVAGRYEIIFYPFGGDTPVTMRVTHSGVAVVLLSDTDALAEASQSARGAALRSLPPGVDASTTAHFSAMMRQAAPGPTLADHASARYSRRLLQTATTTAAAAPVGSLTIASVFSAPDYSVASALIVVLPIICFLVGVTMEALPRLLAFLRRKRRNFDAQNPADALSPPVAKAGKYFGADEEVEGKKKTKIEVGDPFLHVVHALFAQNKISASEMLDVEKLIQEKDPKILGICDFNSRHQTRMAFILKHAILSSQKPQGFEMNEIPGAESDGKAEGAVNEMAY